MVSEPSMSCPRCGLSTLPFARGADRGSGAYSRHAHPRRRRQRLHRRPPRPPAARPRPRPRPDEPRRAAARRPVPGQRGSWPPTSSTRQPRPAPSRASRSPTTSPTRWAAASGLRRAGPAGGAATSRRRPRAPAWPDRLPRRPGRRRRRPLAPPGQPPRDRRGAGGPRRAGHRVPGGGHHRVRERLVRDPAPPHRAAAGHDHAALGGDALPADRHPRRAGLPRGRPRPPRSHRDRGDRRPGRPLVRRHDADLRPPARPAPADDPGPGPHAAPELVLGEPRLAGPVGHRAAAHRGPAQRGRRPRPGSGRGLRPPPAALRRGPPAGHRPDRPPRRRVDLVRRPRRPRQGEPLVGDLARGDDRRATPADDAGPRRSASSPRSSGWAATPAGRTRTSCGGSAG